MPTSCGYTTYVSRLLPRQRAVLPRYQWGRDDIYLHDLHNRPVALIIRSSEQIPYSAKGPCPRSASVFFFLIAPKDELLIEDHSAFFVRPLSELRVETISTLRAVGVFTAAPFQAANNILDGLVSLVNKEMKDM